MNLYEIDESICNCVDAETGEVLDLELLEELSMVRDQKIENVALFYKNTLAETKAIDDEIKAMQTRKKVLENKSKGLKGYLENALQGKKFSTPRVSISFRKSTSVDVEDVFKLDEPFVKYIAPEPNKTAIKNAIKDGIEVPGAKLVVKFSTIIK